MDNNAVKIFISMWQCKMKAHIFMCCVRINPYSTGSGKELHVRRSQWALAPMGAHSPCLIQLLVPLESQQLEQDYLDHTQGRQASLATTRYTTQTTRHSVKKLQVSHKKWKKQWKVQRKSERRTCNSESITTHTHTHACTHANLEKHNTWQQIVI